MYGFDLPSCNTVAVCQINESELMFMLIKKYFFCKTGVIYLTQYGGKGLEYKCIKIIKSKSMIFFEKWCL